MKNKKVGFRTQAAQHFHNIVMDYIRKGDEQAYKDLIAKLGLRRWSSVRRELPVSRKIDKIAPVLPKRTGAFFKYTFLHSATTLFVAIRQQACHR